MTSRDIDEYRPRRAGRYWTVDARGILRAAPARQQARTRADLARLAALQAEETSLEGRHWTPEEMKDGYAAVVKASKSGGTVTLEQRAAARAYQQALDATTRTPRQRGSRAADEILTLVDQGMTLAEIAAARSCRPWSVLARLWEVGEHATAQALQDAHKAAGGDRRVKPLGRRRSSTGQFSRKTEPISPATESGFDG